MLSGFIAGEAFGKGQNLMNFRFQALAFVIFYLVVVLLPVTVFGPIILRAKWEGLEVYGTMASRYVQDFENRWITESGNTKIIGTDDIQSLADLANSYALIQQITPVPFTKNDVMWLLIATAAPLLPLVFFVFSPEQILDSLIKVIF